MSKVGNSFAWIGMRLIVAIIIAAIIICGVLFYKKIDKERFTIPHGKVNGDIIILKEEIKRFIDISLTIIPPEQTDIRSFFSVGLIAKPGFKEEIKSFTRGYTLAALKSFFRGLEKTFLESLCKNVSPMNRNQDADYDKMVRELIRKQVDALVMFYNEILTALDSKTIELGYNKNRLENQIKCILKSVNFLSQATRNDIYYGELANKFYELIFKILNKEEYDYCENINMTPPYTLASTYINAKNKVKECKPESVADEEPNVLPPQDESALYMPYDSLPSNVLTTRGKNDNANHYPSGQDAYLSTLGDEQWNLPTFTRQPTNTTDSSSTSASTSASGSDWQNNYSRLFGSSGSTVSTGSSGSSGSSGSNSRHNNDFDSSRGGNNSRGSQSSNYGKSASKRHGKKDKKIIITDLTPTNVPNGSNAHTYSDAIGNPMEGNVYLKDAQGPNNFFFPTILIET
jgi:hypothetical protein